jgi:hypothetical protein
MLDMAATVATISAILQAEVCMLLSVVMGRTYGISRFNQEESASWHQAVSYGRAGEAMLTPPNAVAHSHRAPLQST